MRIASVPHGHVYVEHLSDPDRSDGVLRLPDPTPKNPAVGAPWWPLVMLDARWIHDHAGDFDLYHLHFGFDSVEPAELNTIVDALREHAKPLVYTVHDLRNPHQLDRRTHDAALDVLVPAADELITLTPGAADEIARRWGRRAHVVEHPHVVGFDQMRVDRPERATPRVGLHLKSMRANLDPLPVIKVLVAEQQRRDFELVIDVHTDVMTPGEYNHTPDVVDFLGNLPGGVEVHVHDFYTDEELWDYFRSLDLSVLPYRFGTHSGWLEACHDVGTRVLAPHLGYYHQQHDGVLGYHVDDGVPRAADIVAALDAMGPSGDTWRADPQDRLEQRRDIAAAHHRIYTDALARA